MNAYDKIRAALAANKPTAPVTIADVLRAQIARGNGVPGTAARQEKSKHART